MCDFVNNDDIAELEKRLDRNKLPKHIAIIMDGNGRWARDKGKPRIVGHKAGIESVRDVATTVCNIGIPYLTLYAFSVENWQRPKLEINTLMSLLVEYLQREVDTLMKNEIRLRVIGRMEDLPNKAAKWLEKTMEVTRANKKMQMILALSYSGRAELVDAFKKMSNDVSNKSLNLEKIDENIISSYLYANDCPDPDMLIRTGGETRISNFLLWQIAYTELLFTKTSWPDFRKKHVFHALLEFQARERRFGLVSSKTNGAG